MKQGDGVFLASKEQLFVFIFYNKFLWFSISEMSTKESFVEKLQKQAKERLQKFREEKTREIKKIVKKFQHFVFVV